MRLYTFPFAPNPRKVHTYLGEKGLEIPLVWVDLLAGEHKEPAFLAINPAGALPVLELDDGTRLGESLAIIEYLEELHPDPPLIGTTPLERARTRRLERMAELGVLGRVARVVHGTRSPLPGVAPRPEMAEQFRKELPGALAALEREIGDGPFLAGERPTVADCTLFAAVEFGRLFELDLPGAACPRLARWHAAFRERPSARIPAPPG